MAEEKRLTLSDRQWKEFTIGELFTLKVAKSNDKGKLETGTVPFVGRSNDNNGLQGFYDAPNITIGQCITLGMVGTFRAFWQERDFAASQNILTLRAPWLNKHNALFMCNIIEIAIDGRYSYGNSIKAGTFGDTVVNIPTTSDGLPDYEFMENYIKQLYDDFADRVCVYTEQVEENADISLSDREWKEFKVGELFTFTRGKRVNKRDTEQNQGKIPLVSGGDENNAVMTYINDALASGLRLKDSCISVASYGSSGSVHYHGYKCCIHDNALALNLKNTQHDNPYVNLFMVAILKTLKKNYAYGRPVIADRYSEEIISLPVTPEGQPDYDFMEQYIKSLPFSKAMEI